LDAGLRPFISLQMKPGNPYFYARITHSNPMKSKPTLLSCIAAAFLVVCPPSLCAKSAPNILLVYIDDLGWTDTSVEMIRGNPQTKSNFYQTPQLERLAKQGRVFSDAYAPAPVCTPSRNAMLHGMTPARMLNSTLNFKVSQENYRGKITIPQALKQANPDYITAHFGKWHIPAISPEKAGYDVSENMKGTGNGEGDFLDDMKTFLPEEDPKRIFSLTDMSKEFISEQVEAEKPFFLQLSHYSVHIWHDSLKETREKYRALPRPPQAVDSDYLPDDEISVSAYKHNWLLNYAAMVEDTDRAFGDLLDHLEKLGIADNTYVIFTSDNGGGMRGNPPLRGAKGDLTEGGIRVPFIVRGPGISAGSTCKLPTAGWDILPTLYALAGGKDSLPEELDGVSITAAMFEGDQGEINRPGNSLIFHFPWYNGEPESAIRQGRFKLLKNLDSQETALYDVEADLSEQTDLSSSYPELTATLEQQLSQYLDQVNAETVNQLRGYFLHDIETSWLSNAEKRAKDLRIKAEAGDASAQQQLEEAEKYVVWLKEQIIFTRERMSLNGKE
jgi:arylsulfatase A